MARVLAYGTFDLLHPGHTGFFTKLRTLAGDGTVVVGVNSDEFAASYKRQPARDQHTRRDDVLATGLVDVAFVQPGFDAQPASILAIAPDLFVVALDWADEIRYAQQLRIPSLAWFDEHNILLLFVTRTGTVSTTELIGA